ncbi:hypothetical protein MTR_3g043760 [Medicago truncatula]|uniref:Uncharacterized protein n=1 Tax=Medicago truncatula TaxID=3880 RepID=G7IZU2_MEDTR|nr:hypothetical protein MTR_3g043760 [Medicago truncatula]
MANVGLALSSFAWFPSLPDCIRHDYGRNRLGFLWKNDEDDDSVDEDLMKMMKKRNEEDEEREEKSVVVDSRYDTMDLHYPTVLILKYRSNSLN